MTETTFVKYHLNNDGKIDIGVTMPCDGALSDEEILRELVRLDNVCHEARRVIFEGKQTVDNPTDEEKVEAEEISPPEEEVEEDEFPPEEEEKPKQSKKKKGRGRPKKEKVNEEGEVNATKRQMSELMELANEVCMNFFIATNTEEVGEDKANDLYDSMPEKEWDDYVAEFLEKMGVNTKDDEPITVNTFTTVMAQLNEHPYHSQNLKETSNEDDVTNYEEDDEYEEE